MIILRDSIIVIAVRRCQPFAGDTALAHSIIGLAVARQAPIPVMMYWGMADRIRPGKPEKLAVEYLAQHLVRVADHYEPGIRLSVVFVDTHIAFNGIRTTEDYFLGIGQMFGTAFRAQKNLHVNLSRASVHVNFNKVATAATFQEFDALPHLVAQSNISARLRETLQHRSKMYCPPALPENRYEPLPTLPQNEGRTGHFTFRFHPLLPPDPRQVPAGNHRPQRL